MEENYFFEITRYHGYLVVMGLDNDFVIKKSSLKIFIRDILANEEVMNAYENGDFSFSDAIDDFTRDDIIAALDEAVTNKKMVDFKEAIEYE